ncbi:MAG TPA: DegT/DnrJ/EryC1/StrS family aminotransferase [Vicinamibacterales bacterium]|nr:DegT/DnrJ/EryC1/StrS family aminotransferase [Vicinamibacterales bacterium]
MKQSLESLALFGGAPAFGDKLHVGRPNIGNRERFLDRVNGILDARVLSNSGPYEQELERRISEEIGAAHCIAVCNGTIALEMAIRALDLTGEVIVPSFTFIATVHVLHWLNLTPVFCDVDPLTHNLDPRSVERLVTPRTSAILGVHLWGRPCDVPALTAIAARHHLKLLFDAAHAFRCGQDGTMVGNFGNAEVFSFHATKWFNTFEGGMVATNDAALGARIRLMRNFGFHGYDTVDHVGTNGKMHEVSAAMGLTSLESADEFVDANRRNYLDYERQLRGLPGVRLVSFEESQRTTYAYVVLEIDEAVTGVSRDALQQTLWAENVIARRYFYPGCHRMEPYRTLYPDAGALLPVTERLAQRVLILPTGTAVSAGDVSTIAAVLRTALGHAEAIRDRTSRVAIS